MTKDYVRRQCDWWDRNIDDYVPDPDLAYEEYVIERAAEERERTLRGAAA